MQLNGYEHNPYAAPPKDLPPEPPRWRGWKARLADVVLGFNVGFSFHWILRNILEWLHP